MENKECVICGIPLLEEEEDVCEICLNFLESKYSSTKLKQVIKWHKKQSKKLRQ
jgi:hypothetical protein